MLANLTFCWAHKCPAKTPVGRECAWGIPHPFSSFLQPSFIKGNPVDQSLSEETEGPRATWVQLHLPQGVAVWQVLWQRAGVSWILGELSSPPPSQGPGFGPHVGSVSVKCPWAVFGMNECEESHQTSSPPPILTPLQFHVRDDGGTAGAHAGPEKHQIVVG